MNQKFFDEFSSVLHKEEILNSQDAHQKYFRNTIGATRALLGAIVINDSKNIPKILQICQRNHWHLYTISSGKNWGYGSSLPIKDNAIILDLSKLNRIIEVNAKLGHVVLEPGVTQQILNDYLVKHGLPFMTPTTGAGPQCSILGNALEKGYGITPIEDHSLSLISIKGYLPNGDFYESALSSFGAYKSDQVFKWKIGPYVDGLFSQSNFGIATQGTIALVKKPENVMQFLCFVDDSQFENAVGAIRLLKSKLGTITGGINIMNKRRLLSMTSDDENWSIDTTLSEMHIRKMAKKRNLPDWAILGGLYGPDELLYGAKQIISDEFNRISDQTIFLDRNKVRLAKKFLKIIPIKSLIKSIDGLDSALDILQGVPGQVALPLAYLKNPKKPQAENKLINPDDDQCGLIWFSPLLPIDECLIRDFVIEVNRVCLFYEIEPLITLTAISDRCFDSTIPILFNQNNPEEVTKAKECHLALMQMSHDFGIFPYRLDIDSMNTFFKNNNSVAVETWYKIKKAIDPNLILSPGRYSKS